MMKKYMIPCALSCFLLTGCVSSSQIDEVVKGTYALYNRNGTTYISYWISFSEYFPVRGFYVDMEPLRKYQDLGLTKADTDSFPLKDPFEKNDHTIHQGMELVTMIKAEDIDRIIAEEDPLTMYFQDDWGKTHSISVYYNPEVVPAGTQ